MVKDKQMIGREEERIELDREVESDRSEVVIVYGRQNACISDVGMHACVRWYAV